MISNIPNKNNTKLKIPKIKMPKMPKMPKMGVVTNTINFVHTHISYLNNSKFFAGCIMILLNVGSKFISIQFSKSTEEYLKMNVTKEILVFAMAWMGTRDIYAALVLTAVFVVLSDHLMNEDSSYCVIPHNYRVLDKIKKSIDENGDSDISTDEINNAIFVLEKTKKQKEKEKQAFLNKKFIKSKM